MSALLVIDSLSVMRGAQRVLRDVSFEVRPGEIVALLGPNGAGKSTLLRAALGLCPRSSGSVRIGALDPATADRRALARAVALLPEHAGAGSGLTVRDVVRTGRFAHVSRFGAEAAADRSAVDAAIEALSLSPMADRVIDSLSAGERKRALLARCFAQDAPLTLLDEPTSTLDLGHARALFTALRTRIADRGGALVAMHDLALAASISDRVIALSEGRIVASGTTSDVLGQSEVVEKLLGTRAHVDITDDEIALHVSRR